MIIVCSVCDSVEELFDSARLPPVDELRPSSCPLCGELAFSPGKRFGIVGHGTYQRQVLGVIDAAEAAITLVRRYLCRGCERTINILSDHLHPRRWYGGGAILEALKLHLLEDLSEREIRERFGIAVDSGSWRTLRRWRSELLLTLWYWLARRLGLRGKARTRDDGRLRLRRLFAEVSTEPKLCAATTSRSLLCGTAHFQGVSWPVGRNPPEELQAQKPL